MKKQTNGFYTPSLLKTLVILLASYIGKYFTEFEVDYILESLDTIIDGKGVLTDPKIFQFMYKRFSLACPDFKAAWDAIEKSNDDPQKLAAIEKKYDGTARLAALVMDVRSLTREWRDVSPIKKSKAK